LLVSAIHCLEFHLGPSAVEHFRLPYSWLGESTVRSGQTAIDCRASDFAIEEAREGARTEREGAKGDKQQREGGIEDEFEIVPDQCEGFEQE
jgi:hypothetical protein